MSNPIVRSAYVLHRTAYRESGALVTALCDDDTVIRMIARGLHRKKNPLSPILQPFQKVELSFKPKEGLVNLQNAELSQKPHVFPYQQLAIGYYLNEIIGLWADKGHQTQGLFDLYSRTLSIIEQAIELDDKASIEQGLRQFEIAYLRMLGHDLQAEHDASGRDLRENERYRYSVDEGYIYDSQGISGAILLKESLVNLNEDERRSWKQLTRSVINQLLGAKSLKSRAMFSQLTQTLSNKRTST